MMANTGKPNSNILVIDNNDEIKVKDKVADNDPLKHLMAGAVAGVVSRTTTAPLDRLKIYLQVNGLGQFGSLRLVARSMYTEGGLKGFWRGNGINVLKVAPNSAITFMAYDALKRQLQDDKKSRLTTAQRFVAGGLAGVLSSSIIYPLDTLKTRLALRKTGQYRGISHAASSIYYNEGPLVFYRGLLPNIFGIIPYAGIELALYETLKNSYIERYPSNDEPTMVVLLGCGMVASTLGQLVTYPLALVRTRLQAPAPVGGTMTMTGVFRSIAAAHGLRGLYSGILPNYMKAVPSVGINYVVYEKCRHVLGVKMT